MKTSLTSTSPRAGNAMVKILGLVFVVVVMLVVVLTGFIVIAGPGWVQNTLAQRTGFPVSASSFNINPLAGRITLKDFEIKNPAEFGGGTFIKVPNFAIEADINTLMSQKIHIRELNLHVAEVTLVTNEAGLKNTQVFAEKLRGKTEAAPANTPAKEQPKRDVVIDRLALRFDTANVVNLATKPAKKTNVNLGLNIERTNVASLQELQTQIMTAAMSSGLRNMGPVVVQELSGSALGGVNAAGQMTAEGVQKSIEGASRVTEKVGNVVQGIKGIFGK